MRNEFIEFEGRYPCCVVSSVVFISVSSIVVLICRHYHRSQSMCVYIHTIRARTSLPLDMLLLHKGQRSINSEICFHCISHQRLQWGESLEIKWLEKIKRSWCRIFILRFSNHWDFYPITWMLGIRLLGWITIVLGLRLWPAERASVWGLSWYWLELSALKIAIFANANIKFLEDSF